MPSPAEYASKLFLTGTEKKFLNISCGLHEYKPRRFNQNKPILFNFPLSHAPVTKLRPAPPITLKKLIFSKSCLLYILKNLKPAWYCNCRLVIFDFLL